MRIAFYAPMKPPDHPTPSGDRRMAQLLMSALCEAGYGAELVSRFRTYLASPDPKQQNDIHGLAEREVERIKQTWSGPNRACDLWFTYHNYHKAPDLLGPVLARLFGIPYVIAEGSRSSRRATEWTGWYAAAEAANRAAAVHLCFTPRDRAGLATSVSHPARLIDLPPFIDDRSWSAPDFSGDRCTPRIVTTAMMRPGDKLASYRLLAEALALVLWQPWTLTIVGDGAARAEVAAAFAGFDPSRITWCGMLPAEKVIEVLRGSDLYAWPGFGEAFGLGYLEAQAMGLPVVALDVAGVSSAVVHDTTGVLVGDPSPASFAAALGSLLADSDRRRRLGRSAADWVRRDRTVAGAARTLSCALTSATMHRLPALDG